MARAAIALWGVVLAGCDQTGSVTLVIDVPTEMRLSPMDERLARLTLVTQAQGQPARQESRDVDGPPARGESIAFGDVATGPAVRIDLLATSPSGRLLGFGRAASLVSVAPEDDVTVPIRLRRPFAYVAGGEALWAFDTTLDPGIPYALSLPMPVRPVAIATTPDGAEVVVAVEGSVVLVSTATHATTGGAADLQPGALDVAVSPDSRWAVVTHVGGISIVDLAALRQGNAPADYAALDAPADVAIGADTAYVLTDAATPGSCEAPSHVVPVPLAATPVPRPRIDLASGARDLAVVPAGPRAGSIIVAEPCRNALIIAAADGSGQTALLQVPSPTSVAAAEDRVWGVGWEGNASELHLVLASVGADGQGRTRLDLPPTEALAKSNDLEEPGQVTEDRLGADQLEAYDLAVVPGARHVAFLLHGNFHADPVVRTVIIGGMPIEQVILPRIDMETYEYLLVDVTTGAVAQRTRTTCTVDWEHDVAVIDDWSCASSPGQDTSDETFIPLHQAVLYGGN